MKVLLSGYNGSKSIISASAYLAIKHLKGFDIYYLNYGDFNGELFGAHYVKLKEEQKNGSLDWSNDIAEYLETLKDKKIIFALDDYFLEKDIDMYLYKNIDPSCKTVNLCTFSENNGDMISVTTQYTLWDVELLIEILGEVQTPWEFEINGSKYFNKLGIQKGWCPALSYPEWSALSNRWKGVRTYGKKVKYL